VPVFSRIADYVRLVRLAMRMIAGRRYWIAPLLPLLWIGFQVFRLVIAWRPDDYGSADAQSILIGFPLVVLAIGLGVKVIAGEIDRRTLEIAYTVPGGAHQVWIAKLLAAVVLLTAALALSALATFLFCTEFPLDALYGAMQGAIVYLVLSMALSALFKSEAVGALACAAVLTLNLLIQGANLRISPFWNPEAQPNADPADLLAWTVQNRIGFVIAILAVLALAFGRAERREKLLGG
jgi:hypothetical protein